MNIKNRKSNNIIVLAPHTDDGEFGCGGTISKFLEDGYNLYYVAFSTARESVPDGLPKNILEIEVKEATKRLGIPPENLMVHGFTVRKLNYVRQDILEELVKLKRELQPELVLMTSPNDVHQDHYTVSQEGLRAFKTTSILAYEIPWNHIQFNAQSFVKLEERHVKAKINALDAYNSQKMRSYASEDFIRSWAKTRGVQIGCEYAEVFEVIRWII